MHAVPYDPTSSSFSLSRVLRKLVRYFGFAKALTTLHQKPEDTDGTETSSRQSPPFLTVLPNR